jgi:MauM/NapG family ferredoxin protein
MKAQTLRKVRRWVQLLAFLLFVFLLIGAGRTTFLPADLFFRLDPLVGLTSMVAARQVVPALLIGSLIMLAASLILGRVWCGWLCPLGTVLDWTPAHRARPKESDLPARWRQVKYFLLALILLMAVLGSASFLFLDPITLIYRTATVAAWPALNALVTGAEAALYSVPWLRGALDAFEGALRGTVLPTYQPLYGLGILAALLFGGALALNAVRDRFWCRYLCPLGALLGLVSKFAWLRRTVGSACIDCQRCARACPTGTIDATHGFESDPAECTLCLECVPVCARAEQHFVWRAPWRRAGSALPVWRPYDPSRRQFIASAAVAISAVGLFGSERAAGRDDARLIRPPGWRKPEFTAQCIRCGVCLKVCPSSGLQPSLTAAGWAGTWTPVLAPRLGACDFSCNACGQACPTGAIAPLALEEKQQTVIGHAYIDRSRCIPWVDGRNCIVCEEMCPLPDKAVKLEEIEVWTPDGSATVRRPYVVHDRCIGCGICENKCPLKGEPAIRVYPPSEVGVSG